MPVIQSSEPRDESRKYITVYLTGFGAFRDYTKNPSWEIVSSFLPSTSVSTDLYNISIVPHPEPVKVAYETVDTLIPKIHAEKKFDYILHVGVGLSGGYEIETVAYEKGYEQGDVDGLIPGGIKAAPSEKGEAERRKGRQKRQKGGKNDTGDTGGTTTRTKGGSLTISYPDGGKAYKTDLDVERIIGMVDSCAIVPKETPEDPIVIKKSADAGRYMCEYIFRTSLMCAAESTRRVLFFHVPPEDEPYSIKTGSDVLEKFIIAYVTEGERIRRKREKEL